LEYPLLKRLQALLILIDIFYSRPGVRKAGKTRVLFELAVHILSNKAKGERIFPGSVNMSTRPIEMADLQGLLALLTILKKDKGKEYWKQN